MVIIIIIIIIVVVARPQPQPQPPPPLLKLLYHHLQIFLPPKLIKVIIKEKLIEEFQQNLLKSQDGAQQTLGLAINTIFGMILKTVVIKEKLLLKMALACRIHMTFLLATVEIVLISLKMTEVFHLA